MAEAVQRCCQIFFQHAGKILPRDRSALSSVRRIDLALLKLRVELGMQPGSWLNRGFDLIYRGTNTSHHNLGSAINI